MDSRQLRELRDRLRDHAREIALTILGKPSSITRTEWRWGRKGSLALAIAGPKRGLWRDHESGEGGDLFDLIKRVRGGDFATAAAYAADIVSGAVIKPSAEWKTSHNRGTVKDDEETRTEKCAAHLARVALDHRHARGTLSRRVSRG